MITIKNSINENSNLKIRIPTPKPDDNDDNDDKIKSQKYSIFKYILCCMFCY